MQWELTQISDVLEQLDFKSNLKPQEELMWWKLKVRGFRDGRKVGFCFSM